MTNIRRARIHSKAQDVCLRADPDSPHRILISTNENKERGTENGARYRRRTMSFKARRPAEKRRASVPAYYKLNVKPKTTRKNLIQKIGSRLAKLGDELIGRKAGQSVETRYENHESLKRYGRHLAEVGDYLNELYSSENSVMYCESYNTALAESCVVISSILVGLKNNNVVVVDMSDLSMLSSLCRVHRSNSLSRNRK